MSEELRPCPFCGNAAKLNDLSWYEQVDTTPYIACDCGLYFAAKTVEELVARWNARPAGDAAPDGGIQAWLDLNANLNARLIIDMSKMSIELDALRARVAEMEAAAIATGETSDGYHTFNELYEHRHALFLALMRKMVIAGGAGNPWVERDSNTEGWFLAGIDTLHGQISYHLPDRLFDTARRYAVRGYQRVPYDGYTSQTVLARLQRLADYAPQEVAK